MSKAYYTLALLWNGQWQPQFGDYARKVALDEAGEYRRQGDTVRIVESADNQAAINAAVAALPLP